MHHVEGQPYSRLPVFRIAPVTGGGKVRVVYQNLLLPFGGSIEQDPGKEENQQDVNEPQDSILAVSGNRGSEAEVVLKNPKSVGEDDAICVQHIQTKEKPNYWAQTIWGWVKALYECH